MRAPERGRRTRSKTLLSDFRAHAVDPLVEAERGSGWPLVQWQADPVGFCREVLGVRLMPHQEAILESIRDNEKTAVRSGQKTGKTKLLICAAIWFYSCFPKARVIMTANTKDQVRNVLWKELRDTLRESKLRIEGRWSDAPSTGFRATDGREIFGITARDIESMAGVSGGAMMFLVDEASALPDTKAEALEGNRAGSGTQRMAWISNPTRAEGPFFEAFHSKAEFWTTFHLSSEEVAQWQVANDVTVPGAANLGRIEGWREEYGVDSPFYTVRVKGNFLLHETGKVVSLHVITQAQDRYGDAPDEGPLSIGIDPAGEGVGGDETAFAIVRGVKLIGLFAFRGVSEDAIIEHLSSFLETYRQGEETPRVTVDSEGPIGARLYWRLRARAEKLRSENPRAGFTCFGCRASLPATREPRHYERTREELWASLAKWLRDEGAIPKDHKLAQELHAPSWLGTVQAKMKITPKPELRELLGRSPDRAEGLALAVWAPSRWAAEGQESAPSATPSDDFYQAPPEIDQYAASDVWWPKS
jgi:phage terminase large subunit